MTRTIKNGLVRRFLLGASAPLLLTLFASCEEGRSYAELLSDENKAVNWFLADHKVYAEIPADSVFETGEDAPYYCIDSENSIYMQVLDAGTGEKAVEGQQIYFRYLRVALNTYSGKIYDEEWTGNANNISATPTYFKFDDFDDQSSVSWGTGIQQPLHFLPIDCHVRLVVKSQYGQPSLVASVVPYVWDLRYFPSRI